MNTKLFTAPLSDSQLTQAAEIIQNGGLLGIPTETVYGLGASALDETACLHIFEAKGRPQDNPLIIHVPDESWLPRYCHDIPPAAYALARVFWPGPLTMILPRKDIVPLRTTGGLDTVGIRCPNHPVTLDIIRRAGVPIAAPSGNTSGRPSPTTAQHMVEDMWGKIDGIVDGGPCGVGVESTIIDLTCEPPRLLRPGGLPLEALEEILGEVQVDKAVVSKLAEGERPKAPGMKYRHYAPKAPVTVVTGEPAESAAYIRSHMGKNSGIICFHEFISDFEGHIVHDLGYSDDKSEQARRVFDALRTFDGTSVPEIWAQCPDDSGLGLAIGNRLKKAAGWSVMDAGAQGMRPVIGVTGGTGCGKTTALNALERLGFTVIDCDALYHEMLATCAPMLADLDRAFPGVLENGVLQRKKLGRFVFADQQALDKLNRTVWPHVVNEVRQLLDAHPANPFAIDAIGLLESGLGGLCTVTVAVTAPLEARVARLMAREGIPEDYARLRIAAQKSDRDFAESCGHELNNNFPTKEAFGEYCNTFFRTLLNNI